MQMKKFINDPQHLLPELLEGLALAFPRQVRLVGTNIVARTVPKAGGKVRLVTLGGSGHEPGLSGFVGEGMLDYSVTGEIFAAPGAPRCIEAIQMAAKDSPGVLLVVLNHAGDVLSANITMQSAEKNNIPVQMVLTRDGISYGQNSDSANDRRGLVGCMAVYKVAGAAAEQGASLDECLRIAQKMEENTRSLAVALRTATHPSTGHTIFELGDDEMEIGMGQHGEAGTGRMKMKSADETADIMLDMLLENLGVAAGENLLVVLNGSGATTLMELWIVFRAVSKILKARNIHLVRSAVGEFITTQEQAGFQIMIARMDAELVRLWDAPSNAPYFVTR